MNRRWQKEGKGRYETLESIDSLSARFPALQDGGLNLCDEADLYATYSALHSKGRKVEVATNLDTGFHYFLIEADSKTAAPSQSCRPAGHASTDGAGMTDSGHAAQTEGETKTGLAQAIRYTVTLQFRELG